MATVYSPTRPSKVKVVNSAADDFSACMHVDLLFCTKFLLMHNHAFLLFTSKLKQFLSGENRDQTHRQSIDTK